MAQKPSKKISSVDLSDKVESVEKEKIEKIIKTPKKAPAKKKTVSTSKTTSLKEEIVEETVSTSMIKEPETTRKTDRGSVLLGIGMLIMGGLLLAGKFLQIPFGQFLWPFILIVPGALVFLSAISSDSSSGEGLSILGGILSALGLVLLMQSVTGFWASWTYIWALIAPTSVG
mgnify:CR=1 FL=1